MMFWASLAFLVILAGFLCEMTLATSTLAKYDAFRVTAPMRTGESAQGPQVANNASPDRGLPTPLDTELVGDEAPRNSSGFAWVLLMMYPIFWAESIAHRLVSNTAGKQEILACLFPPLRMGGRDHVTGEAIWLPSIGWATVGTDLQLRIERAFSGPMILIALAVLPLLGFEWYLQSRAVAPGWKWGVFLRLSEYLIWLAFTIEFIIMLSVSTKKLGYCRQHWIDIVIIILPLIAFLRVLRLGRVLRLHHVAKAGRAYRLRGLGIRMFRGVLLLDLSRLLFKGDLTVRLGKMREELAERELEVRRLQGEIEQLEAELADEKLRVCEVPRAEEPQA
jgi:voltage-gated potassium channel